MPLRLHLVDTSAAARFKNPAVQKVVVDLLTDRAAATCVTVDLEAGFSCRNLAEIQNIAKSRRSHFTNLPINETIAERAREVQVLLGRKGHHRAVGPINLLTAAVAEYHGAVVVHYDEDFEHIASVTRQPHVWVAPRGTID
ncbi:PIN domain-containing protein [Nocardia sp. NPDC051570]|uniref:PIN domain-containing protein n=1 Tax=Nocardia sp. NPDC051570 TaxID=3364324 RepID=UPI0037BDD512